MSVRIDEMVNAHRRLDRNFNFGLVAIVLTVLIGAFTYGQIVHPVKPLPDTCRYPA